MSEYAARCWGGPLDGQWIASDRPEIRAARTLRSAGTLFPIIDPTAYPTVSFREDTYGYKELLTHDDCYGFWIVTAPLERVEAIMEQIVGTARLIYWMAGR